MKITRISYKDYLTPLRYPGGKTQITSHIEHLLIKNNLIGNSYCEPFAGGCGIAWQLLLNGKVSQVFINDISPAVYSFWWSVLNRTNELCMLIRDTPITIDEWHRQRKIHLSEKSGIKLGFSTLFLNRTNRSGILSAGPIGGKKQLGKYKLDCRFNKEATIEKIRKIASYKNSIKLSNLDAKELIKSISKLDQKILLNIDPPYYKKGEMLYQNFFQHNDHIELFKAIQETKHHWIVTYDDSSEIFDIYKEFNPKRFSLNYSLQNKRKAEELIIYSPNLLI